MLVRAQVIHDAAPLFGVDHIGVEAPRPARVEGANPRDGLASQRVHVSVVLNCKGDVLTLLREHDAPPRTQVQEWQRVKRPMPDARHDAAADTSQAITTAEAETSLDLRVQAG